MEPELEERLYPDGAGASDWPDWPVPARGWWYLEDRQEDELSLIHISQRTAQTKEQLCRRRKMFFAER